MSKTTIYVCNGKNCKEDDSKKTRNAFRNLVEEQGLDNKILVDSCNCMGKCGKGPVVRVEPAGLRAKYIAPKKCSAFLESLLAGTLEKEFDAKKKKD